MGNIKDSFTFDDVTLVPKYSSILPSEAATSIKISHNLNLQIPLMSSAMDTVTESKMAIALSKSGGIGVVHRNLSIQKQVQEVKKVKKNNFPVGAAIGVNPKDIERVYKLLEAKVNLIVIDTAHGHTQKVLSMIKKIKKKFKKSTLCAGNIATGKAAIFLADAGVDIVKVGIGPGSICTTRLVTGIGVPADPSCPSSRKARWLSARSPCLARHSTNPTLSAVGSRRSYSLIRPWQRQPAVRAEPSSTSTHRGSTQPRSMRVWI